MTLPYQNSPATVFIAVRIHDLAYRKSQAEIALEAGFPNANMMTYLKNGRNKVPLDRVPSLAKALEVDPAYLMRLALDQAVGETAAKAITEIFGTSATENEQNWLVEIRDASDNSDPRLTGRSRAALRAIFGK
ncbi:XRE family transcriptional regulator [Paracoccus liaowanqingii]|uniref:XRE family transcriptional regulator n=1 Tax=Paracoccus liaowanqingii TaxID=2560053 RepID=A0A4Z1BKV4_9RHOB|nr:helix-turn-helix transcriptional regulator [Paracoccus liaowanqingii]TGN60931.1 XRE family transcriptional regulator [Paracoccus liaowanqingii]